MVQGGEGRPQPQPQSVGLGRYFLLNHVGLSYLIYGLMLATSSSSPTTCWPVLSLLSPLCLHVAAISALYQHCISLSHVVTVPHLDSFPRTSRYQHNNLFWYFLETLGLSFSQSGGIFAIIL